MSLGVPNTENGHCSKTTAIIDHLARWIAGSPDDDDGSPGWYVIADDDTILGYMYIHTVLGASSIACFRASRPRAQRAITGPLLVDTYRLDCFIGFESCGSFYPATTRRSRY